MARIDGYSAADAPTGQELLPVMQDGQTRSMTANQLLAWLQARLGQSGGVAPTTSHVLLRDGVSRVLCRDGSFLSFR